MFTQLQLRLDYLWVVRFGPVTVFPERCPLMATEEQGISSNPMRCQTRFSIYSSLSMLFIHDIFLSTQKIVPHIKFSKLNQCIQLLWPTITAGLDDVYTHRF